ncbi:death domain-containing protein CRADD-like [Asterias rubens]|uniref:death domain-containing protein CRADD-like n=1 Tax=Asterias rubens TaxID=7604 RepID=UPI0014552AA6|nr:death domain-containing protein CRADD-like [Asterias rubens]
MPPVNTCCSTVSVTVSVSLALKIRDRVSRGTYHFLVKMPHTSASIYDTNGVICDRKLLSISTVIGQRYPELGIKLGITMEQIMAVRARAPNNLQHQVFHTLDLWRKRDGREATLEKLNQTLKELGWTSVMTQIRNTPDNFYVVT